MGYAVTCVYGLPDPNFAGRLSFMDVVDALDAMKKPTVLVIQQKWPPEIHAKAGLAGEMMISSMMAVGCIGMISNGPSRDIDAIRKLRFSSCWAASPPATASRRSRRSTCRCRSAAWTWRRAT